MSAQANVNINVNTGDSVGELGQLEASLEAQERKLAAFQGGIDVIGGSVESLVGGLALLGVENEYIQNLEQGSNLLISGIGFCNNEFLQKSEYYLKSKFPNLKITRVYFENDPVKAELNIRYRDKQNGGYWQENEKGEMWYHGTIFELKPLYQLEIKNANTLSQNYTIPEDYLVFPIIVQKE